MMKGSDFIKGNIMEKSKDVLLLDCTLRDGGLGLEDAAIKGISAKIFSTSDRKDMTKLFTESDIDIVEIGAIEISDGDKSGSAIYPDIESISKEPSINKLYL
jgi:4-hydroxy 2-oxovalerate aldolase